MATAKAQPHESKLYYEFSHLYDRLFGPVFYRRIKHLIRSLSIPPGARVLELGVGTGLSLDAYPPHCRVTGVDLAPDMLELAEDKVTRNGWRHISLLQMDALDLRFPDDSFDYVTAFHVVSVVPDPGRMIREAQRVCRPGGTIALINHFRSRRAVVGWLTGLVDPFTRWLGWRTTLTLEAVLAGSSLRLVRCGKTWRYSLFTIVVAQNEKQADAPSRPDCEPARGGADAAP